MFDSNETKSVPETPDEEMPATPETPTPTSSNNDGVNWREVADDVGQFVVDALITIFT